MIMEQARLSTVEVLMLHVAYSLPLLRYFPRIMTSKVGCNTSPL